MCLLMPINEIMRLIIYINEIDNLHKLFIHQSPDALVLFEDKVESFLETIMLSITVSVTVGTLSIITTSVILFH